MDELHELTAAYALNALDDGEERAYEAHLADCARCQEELASLSGTATALAYAAGEATPPDALRGRILEAARAERTNVIPLRARWRPSLEALTAVAACLAIGLGIWNITLQHRLNHRSALAAVLADPSAQRVSLGGGTTGQVVISPKGAALVADLGPAPDRKTWEAWLIPAGGKPIPAGTFDRGGAVLLRGTPTAGMTVAITQEPHGGSRAPTGEIVASANLA
jgi:anti-sigma-K factor RskA